MESLSATKNSDVAKAKIVTEEKARVSKAENRREKEMAHQAVEGAVTGASEGLSLCGQTAFLTRRHHHVMESILVKVDHHVNSAAVTKGT